MPRLDEVPVDAGTQVREAITESDGLVADLDRRIGELQEQRRRFVEESPVREERREQLAGKALMKAVRAGNAAAATWLGPILAVAKESDEGWLFEPEYLEEDGYEQSVIGDGKQVWKRHDLLCRVEDFRERLCRLLPQCVAAVVVDVYNRGAKRKDRFTKWWRF